MRTAERIYRELIFFGGAILLIAIPVAARWPGSGFLHLLALIFVATLFLTLAIRYIGGSIQVVLFLLNLIKWPFARR